MMCGFSAMKIHKKIVSNFLSCTSPVDKEGFLFKKKTKKDTYQRRWLVLKANLLFYQERPADRHLLGVIVLEGCAVRRSDADGRWSFCLLFQGPGLKSYRFAAGDEDTLDGWVRALLFASHSYLSLMLRDLHRQYQEAKHDQSSGGSPTRALNQDPAQLNQQWWLPSTSVDGGKSAVITAASKKCPMRNSYVTPLHSPAPPHADWPSMDFCKLHDYFGQEVKKVREEWLKSQQATAEEDCEGDLIDLP
ncbi:sesquipedalian-1 isoform X1 [Entelurus aequoreus]|uniref:sesquipedalian-1 isoform X1 n=2 Tax=Entelurus aequoreus TaxID=161455 RepID=UPI002B1D4433|nr:sesquipedalian-1 isoform X1 [Entelurus aequoreus]